MTTRLTATVRDHARIRDGGDNAVRKAEKKDIPAIVEIHRQAFDNFFLTRLGRGFLRQYYELVLNYRAGILLVSESRDGIEGFACGFVQPRQFYRMMRSRGWTF